MIELHVTKVVRLRFEMCGILLFITEKITHLRVTSAFREKSVPDLPPNKPNRYGINVIMFDNSIKYLYAVNAEPYLGGLPFGQYFVKQLLTVYGTNMNVMMDNWFTLNWKTAVTTSKSSGCFWNLHLCHYPCYYWVWKCLFFSEFTTWCCGLIFG